MSYDTSRNWFYKIVGDIIQIYEKMSSSKINPDTNGKMVNLDDSSVVYPGENITNGLRIELVNVSSPSESSHINLNSTLSLAVVDYVKAKSFERSGDIEKKEYFMREFYKKLGDNESNNRNIAISMPQGIFSVR